MNRIVSSEVNSYNAELFATEDVEQKQTILYDVIVKVQLLYQQREVHLIFDLVMQRKFKPGYPLFNRMLYDACRLIAKQKIEKANYSDHVPVQSTWICIKDVPKSLANRAFHFELRPYEDSESLDVGAVKPTEFSGLDLIRLDLLLLQRIMIGIEMIRQ